MVWCPMLIELMFLGGIRGPAQGSFVDVFTAGRSLWCCSLCPGSCSPGSVLSWEQRATSAMSAPQPPCVCWHRAGSEPGDEGSVWVALLSLTSGWNGQREVNVGQREVRTLSSSYKNWDIIRRTNASSALLHDVKLIFTLPVPSACLSVEVTLSFFCLICFSHDHSRPGPDLLVEMELVLDAMTLLGQL